ncbi:MULTISPECIES: TadE/TadG family type IV pilus assembly protein [unclassified Pseudomonas]|uniref:TadE/TadG family type IV pilus assembly protein n=1 Tax=unclassified Pseudomonas TaxID=196821 RepID=UPI000C8831C3|nr:MULTISPECIES: TadE/TadG family type IV pilus assembly protein [unclassified Pseudomonas]PMZ90893.1 pilus assembly protein [Pseudomonas sp. FW215-T2]PNA13722.1 pilus assembly protein [Pseudomonas sp. FW215-R3]PNB34604.1 pilus assembly protein [Pseudomonas sp. FW305-131]
MMNLRIQRPFTSTPRRQEGSVSVLMVITLGVIGLMAALALDGGHIMLNKTRLQNAVDAAALSGAKTLSQVEGGTNSASATRTAALNTLVQNANAAGNNELATAVGGNAGAFAVVELASSVYGPFSYPGPTDAKYVRVSVPSYGLTGFFWNFAQVFGAGGLGPKAVAAIATAGPSPTSPCDLAPLMVCGDSTQYNPGAGMFWGFQFGDLQVLKTAAGNSSPIGPGNFQLLDFGSGGSTVREDLAGGGKVCRDVGQNVQTSPGNMVGPTSQGLNTRFGIYNGPVSASDYPPDLVTSSSNPAIIYDDSVSPPQVKYQGQVVTSNNGDLTAGGNTILDYNDWRASVAACVAGGSGCQGNGVFERRMLKIVVGDCTGKQGGSTSIPVLGFGCYFVVQPMNGGGGDAQIFGQFVKECEGDNVAGPSPSTDSGPQIIQLYKTYLNGSGTPSTDS